MRCRSAVVGASLAVALGASGVASAGPSTSSTESTGAATLDPAARQQKHDFCAAYPSREVQFAQSSKPFDDYMVSRVVGRALGCTTDTENHRVQAMEWLDRGVESQNPRGVRRRDLPHAQQRRAQETGLGGHARRRRLRGLHHGHQEARRRRAREGDRRRPVQRLGPDRSARALRAGQGGRETHRRGDRQEERLRRGRQGGDPRLPAPHLRAVGRALRRQQSRHRLRARHRAQDVRRVRPARGGFEEPGELESAARRTPRATSRST